VCAVIGWLAGGAPNAVDVPEKTDITVVGGGAVTPEFLTVLIGLTLYTASYIAEIVRGGIQAVAYGQHEAASALGCPACRKRGSSCCRRRCA
jgi:general L-amino acid transport system permease protein